MRQEMEPGGTPQGVPPGKRCAIQPKSGSRPDASETAAANLAGGGGGVPFPKGNQLRQFAVQPVAELAIRLRFHLHEHIGLTGRSFFFIATTGTIRFHLNPRLR